jgi:TonB family protein
MKFAWFRFAAFVILAHALAWAQQPSDNSSNNLAYENGSITNNVYSNDCFGFSFAIPDGWHINTQVLGPDAKAIHMTKGALVLLMLDQKTEGAFGSIALNTYDASIYDKTVQGFVSRSAHDYVSYDQKYREIVKDAYSVDYAGKTFSRADIKHTMHSGSILYETSVFTKFRGYYVGENLSAGTPEGLELAASSLQGISFHEDKPNPKCVMRGDDNPTGGIIGGVVSSTTSIPQSDSGQPMRIRVSQGVSARLLIKKVEPQYPDDARQGQIEGKVVLRIVIDKNGDVQGLTLVSGHPMLAPAAIEAVKQWKYKPYLLNGQPMAMETQDVVVFRLAGQ